jgi:hypothetical protein
VEWDFQRSKKAQNPVSEDSIAAVLSHRGLFLELSMAHGQSVMGRESQKAQDGSLGSTSFSQWPANPGLPGLSMFRMD